MNDRVKLAVQGAALFLSLGAYTLGAVWYMAQRDAETRSAVAALQASIAAWQVPRANLPDRVAWLEGNVAARLKNIEDDLARIRTILDRRADGGGR